MADAIKTQHDKFKEVARELDCDDDESRFDQKIKRVAKTKTEEGAKREK